MNSIGKKISDARKQKGFTQEELAELAKVNLRTIQRIENNKNEPRGTTLSLICDVLEINKTELQELNNFTKNKSTLDFIINVIYLILLNILLASIIGYLTKPVEANINSRFGAVLLSFFIPFFIVYCTQKMSAAERVLKFGFGLIVDLIILFTVQGFFNGMKTGFGTWLFSCILIFIGTLFYGNTFLRMGNKK